jgi:hypothetical protein
LLYVGSHQTAGHHSHILGSHIRAIVGTTFAGFRFIQLCPWLLNAAGVQQFKCDTKQQQPATATTTTMKAYKQTERFNPTWHAFICITKFADRTLLSRTSAAVHRDYSLCFSLFSVISDNVSDAAFSKFIWMSLPWIPSMNLYLDY